MVKDAQPSRRQVGVLFQGHPRPWPVAKPRTLRVPAHKVPPVRMSLSVLRWISRLGCWWLVEEPVASGTAFRTKKKFFRSRGLTTDLLPCPALRAGSLCSKVSRGAACVNTTAPVDCQASLSVHFRSTLRSYGRFVPLITAGLFASFLKLSKRPSATKAK